jgi:uncharacterized protein YcbX
MTHETSWRAVGIVAALYRHPVKSMRGDALAHATVDRYGLVGDRRFALRRRGDPSGFPWLTAGRVPDLMRYQARFADDGEPTREALRIESPTGESLSLEQDALSAHFFARLGVSVELMHLRQGVFDCAGLSIVSRQTLAALGTLVGAALDERRFRPNVVVACRDGASYPEDAWVGGAVAFGDPALGPRAHVTERDERCSMLGIDPDTGVVDPRILRTVVRERANLAGVYAVPTRVGAVAVGDAVYVQSDA